MTDTITTHKALPYDEQNGVYLCTCHRAFATSRARSKHINAATRNARTAEERAAAAAELERREAEERSLREATLFDIGELS